MQYEQQPSQQLPLVIVEGDGLSLLGRNWLHRIQLNWSHIKAVNIPESLPNILEIFKDVFADGLGMIQSVKAKLSVNESVQPKLFKPQLVPLAIIAAVECELDRLESEGVLEKVDYSKWAAPIVIMLKKDGQVHQVHICSDYKVSQPCSRH